MSDFLERKSWAASVASGKRSIIVQGSGILDPKAREALKLDLDKVFKKHGVILKRFKVGPKKP
jgi:hypothetical protein